MFFLCYHLFVCLFESELYSIFIGFLIVHSYVFSETIVPLSLSL